jgi:hypothetical protein
VVYGKFGYIFSPMSRENHNCMLFKAKVNVMTAECSARAPTAHIFVRSYRKS